MIYSLRDWPYRFVRQAVRAFRCASACHDICESRLLPILHDCFLEGLVWAPRDLKKHKPWSGVAKSLKRCTSFTVRPKETACCMLAIQSLCPFLLLFTCSFPRVSSTHCPYCPHHKSKNISFLFPSSSLLLPPLLPRFGALYCWKILLGRYSFMFLNFSTVSGLPHIFALDATKEQSYTI